MADKVIVDNSITKALNKMGFTGMASALVTAVLGAIIIIYPIQWEHFKLIIGLYLVIVGVMNLTGYIITMIGRNKENIYIETETLKTK